MQHTAVAADVQVQQTAQQAAPGTHERLISNARR